MSLTVPSGWSKIKRTSRIAEFVDGIVCNHKTDGFNAGDSYLLWTEKEFDMEDIDLEDAEESKVTDSGKLPLQSNYSDEVPEDAEYLVEVKEDGLVVEEHFFETQTDAEQFIDGETPDPEPEQ